MTFLSKLANFFNSKKPTTKFPGVVVGKITEIQAHPNADRLRLVKVDVGHILDVVCGAPNIEVSQIVPVATIGAALPNGIVIQAATIRGASSQGMLCAADELGLGSDHSGIHILKGGQPGSSIDAFI